MAKKTEVRDNSVELLKIIAAINLAQYGKSQDEIRSALHVDANWLGKLLKKTKRERSR
jgi:hypothetical protein